MEIKSTLTRSVPEADPLATLEKELGEPVVYRTTGRFLAASGLGEVPLGSWGLLVLTPTRFLFRHFPQPHPLFGGKDAEVRWEVSRSALPGCEARVQPFWTKIFSATPDHLSLTAPGAHLNVETTDLVRAFADAWSRS